MALIQFSGLASGIDSASLIDAIIEQKRQARIEPLQDKINALQDTNSALEGLGSLLGELKSAASAFRLINGGGIARQGISSDETVVSAAASNAAEPGAYDLTVLALAKNGTLSFDDRFSSSTTAIYSGLNDGAPAADRTVSVTIGNDSPETVDIELTSTTTAADFVQQFNAQSDRATASLVNTGTSASPSYALVIRSNETGLAEGELSVSVGSAVSDGGAGAFVTNTLDQATDAEFQIDGIAGTLTRSSNTVSDVLGGVTFNLESTGSATITIANDAAETINGLQDFVDKFNEVVNYIRENDLVVSEENDGELKNIFGPLSGTSLDENVLSSLRSALTGAGQTGGTFNILADLGITTERDGTLKFDSDVFEEALASGAGDVATIVQNLGESLARTGGTIDQFIQFNGLIDTAVNGNENQVSGLQGQVSDLESRLTAERDRLTNRFARLESLVSNLQQQQTALSSIVGGA